MNEQEILNTLNEELTSSLRKYLSNNGPAFNAITCLIFQCYNVFKAIEKLEESKKKESEDSIVKIS